MIKNSVYRDLLSEDKFNDDDEILVVYKFKGTHKVHKIRCTYAQYKNLKSIQSVEYCKIAKK